MPGQAVRRVTPWRHAALRLAATAVALVAAACAGSPVDPLHRARSDAQLQAQIDRAVEARGRDDEPRVFFAGFAPDSRTKAFRGDIEVASRFVASLDGDAVQFKLANRAGVFAAPLPHATRENMALVMAQIARLARSRDKVFVLISSHGHVGKLSVLADRPYASLSPGELAQWLQPLEAIPTVVILSACHAGSFIEALAHPRRIVLTAAAADRSSFGCSTLDANTYFIDALLGRRIDTQASLTDMFARGRHEVLRRERAEGLAPPSNPLAWWGGQMQSLAEAPLHSLRRLDSASD